MSPASKAIERIDFHTGLLNIMFGESVIRKCIIEMVRATNDAGDAAKVT